MTDTTRTHRAYGVVFLLLALALAVIALVVVNALGLVPAVIIGVVALLFLLAGLGAMRAR